MKLEMFTEIQLKAKHSLTEVEELHGHLWNIKIGVTGPVAQGRIASLPEFRAKLEEWIEPLQGENLNKSRFLDPASRENPTCENMAVFFFEKLKPLIANTFLGVVLTSIEISVTEPDGKAWGSAKLS